MRMYLRTLLLPFVGMLCTLAFATKANAQTATISTDKGDYAPGETAIITGTGFQPGENVTLQVLHYPTCCDDATALEHQPWPVTADGSGNISSSWTVPGDLDELGATLQLTAVGDQGSSASWIFTDGSNDKYAPSISPNSFCSGTGSQVFTFKIANTGNGQSVIKSVIVNIPGGLTLTSISGTAFTSGNVSKGSWTNTSTSTQLKFASPGSSTDLTSAGTGDYLNITFTATITATTGTWVTSGFSNNTFSSASQGAANNTGVDPVVTVTPTVGTPTAITVSSGTEPTCQLTNGTTTTTYATTATNSTGFNWSLSNPSAGSINSSSGVMTWANGFTGSVNIQVTANGCNGPSSQVVRAVTVNPTVGTPTAITVSAGTEPTCQLTNGTTTTTYATTAINSTGFNWSLSTPSAGSISSSGVMTWANGFSGSVNIQVTANGCNGPSSQVTRTVTVTPTVGTPTAITVSSGTQPTCQLTNGTTTTTYATTATNNTGFNWSLSNPSAGSINPSSGVMTWANGFSGSVNIQVTANGCNGPSSQVVRTVTVTPTVGTPTAITISSGTEPTCQLTNGTTTTTYATTATNNTGFNWSLSNPSAGSINASGVMTWANGFSGSVNIQVTANGCNGPSSQVVRAVTVNPRPTTVASPASQTVCSGDVATISLSSSVGGTTYTWSGASSPAANVTVSPSSGTSNPISATLTNNTGTGRTVTFTVTPTAAGCVGTAITPTVLVKMPLTTANAGLDQTVSGTSTSLAGNAPGGGETGSWVISSGTGGNVVTPSSPTSTFTGVAGNTYILTWTISNGICSSSDDVTITFNNPCTAPVVTVPSSPVSANTASGVCNSVVNYSASSTGTAPVTNTYAFVGVTTGSGSGTGSGSTFNKGNTTVTVTATNACGSDSKSFTVTVFDNQAPTFTAPPNITIHTGSNCTYNADPSITGDVTDEADNCSPQNATYSDATVAGSCPGSYTITRTWSLTDGTNTTTHSQTITVTDNTAPTFTAPADITIHTDANCLYDASPSVTGDVTDEHDNCDQTLQATYTDVVTDGSCAGSHTITRTWHLQDCSGNAADQVQTITVTDNIAPTFTRPADITIHTDANCSYDASPSATGDVTDEHDNCDQTLQATYTDVVTDGSCAGSHTITRTWHLKDCSNNAAADQVQTITVTDNTAPTFTRPADITIHTTANCSYDASVAATGDVTDEHDNCDQALQASYSDVVTDGSCAGSHTITRTWHLQDCSGNAAADQVQTITVTDNTAPTFTAPADVTIHTDANCSYDASPSVTGDVTNEHDNCDQALQATYTDVVTDGSCAGSHTITRTWHLQDCSGNAAADQVQTITVTDNTAPTFTAPADVTIHTDANCSYDASPSVTGDVTNEHDNCDQALQATYTDVVTDGTCAGSHTITRTWHLQDCSNNAAADQVQTITVTDNTAPTFTRPTDITIHTTANCSYDASVAATGDVTDEHDNCDQTLQATYTDVVTDGSCAGSHTITRTWHLKDCSNNAAADQVQTITVTDNTAPTFTAPANVTIHTDANCSYDASPSVTGDVTNEHDNCDQTLQATYTDVVTDGSCAGSHTITRTWHLKDCSNNAAADQVQTITVTDNTAPTFTAPADVTIHTDANCSYDASPSVTGDVTDEHDNCDHTLQATYTDVVTGGSCAGSHTITRTWHLQDCSGNAAADQVQTITVTDNTAPTFTRPANTTIYTDASCNYNANPGVTGDVTDEHDNCSTGLNATYTDVVTNGPFQGSHVITRTWHLVDDCHNAAADQVQIITVTDNQKPVFTNCPQNITSIGCNNVTYSVTATDNCSAPTYTYSFTGAITAQGTGTGSGTLFPTGTTYVTVTATDASGNASTCSFTVTVITVTTYTGNLSKYLMVFTNGKTDANWQGATKGFAGNVAVNGTLASERTSGSVPYAGTLTTNSSTLGAWQSIVNSNSGQAFSSLSQGATITALTSDLENAFTQINALPVTAGYNGIAATALNGLNTQDGVGKIYVINVTSGFQVSTQIKITGDANDLFILRWDNDANFSNGYNGQVKFQSGGAIVPQGGLTAANFIHVAGDINSSGGGSNPPAPYPQGPRSNNGTGSLINGGSNFNGGGFFTGYWLTTGAPTIFTAGQQPYGETSPQSNAIFVGGWYTKTTKFSMTSGTSGVNVGGCSLSAQTSGTSSPVVAGTATRAAALQVKIMPNPGERGTDFRLTATGKVTNQIEIRVLNMLGKEVFNTRGSTNQTYKFGGNFISGVYLVEVLCGNEVQTLKIVKQ